MSNQLMVVGSVGQVPRIDFFGDSGNKIAKVFIGGKILLQRGIQLWIDFACRTDLGNE